MPRKKRNNPNRWCFPATNLLNQFPAETSIRHIADTLQCHTSNISRWKEGETLLDVHAADHYAIQLGKHPSEIWTNWFDLPEYTPQQRTTILTH